MFLFGGRWVIIIDYDVLDLYNKTDVQKPDKQKIIYSCIAIRNGREPLEVRWATFLGMFKYYAKNPQVRKEDDEIFKMLLQVLQHQVGVEMVEHLLSENSIVVES